MRKKNISPKVIMITGAAGYVGAILCDQFSKSPDVEQIVAIDRLPMPELLKDNKKIIWITANLYQSVWKIPAIINKPEVVIHAAWQTKELYNNIELQRKLNVDSSKAVFEFVFNSQSVRKLIFLSDIFTEREGDERLSSIQKQEVEMTLGELYERNHGDKQVFILRPSLILGPRGYNLGVWKNDPFEFFKGVLPLLPVTALDSARQYVHEDDLTDAIAIFTFSEIKKGGGYDTYVISPSDSVLVSDMAQSIGKRVVKLPVALIKTFFYLMWYLFGGKMPTGRGQWQLYCCPMLVKESRIIKKLGFDYFYTSHDALAGVNGRYGVDDV